MRPRRPAKRHPIGRMGMDAPENAGHLTTAFAPGLSDSEAFSEKRVSTVNVRRTYAVVARFLFKLILYDAVVLWKYIQE